MGLPSDDFWAGERKRLFQVVFPHVLDSAVDAAKQAADDLPNAVQLGVDYDLVNQAVADWAESYTFDLIKDIDKTTQDHVRDHVTQWIEGGGTIGDLTESLKVWFDDDRAKAIAVTEVTRAYAEGNVTAWKQTGLVSMYQFLTAGDSDVDTECREAEANGPYPLDDEEHRPPLHVNCRCYVQPVVEGFENDIPEAGTNYDLDTELQEQLREYMRENADKINAIKDLESPDKLQGQMDELAGQANILHDQIDKLVDQTKDFEKFSPEWETLRAQIKELQDQRDEAMKRYNALDDEMRKLQRQNRAELVDLFRSPNTGNAELVFAHGDTLFQQGMETRTDAAMNFLNNLLDTDKGWGTQLRIGSTDKDRAFFSHNDLVIHVNPRDSIATILHEAGHALENRNKDWLAAAAEFLESRTAGLEAVKHLDLMPGSNYGAWETTKPDDFFNWYVGSQYLNADGSRRSTEITSMGLEWLWRDPVSLATKDPEHFALVMWLLQGGV